MVTVLETYEWPDKVERGAINVAIKEIELERSPISIEDIKVRWLFPRHLISYIHNILKY